MKGLLLITRIPKEKTAASKAREDVKEILCEGGYLLFELPQPFDLKRFHELWKNLRRLTHKQVVIEYPFKARYRLYVVYLLSRLSEVKLFGIIHDIGALRKKTPAARDMIILRLFDGLVSHNASMSEWLRGKGFNKKIAELQMFDYLSEDRTAFCESSMFQKIKILYAGNLRPDKATFLYDNHLLTPENIQLDVYGPFAEKEKINDPRIVYRGTFDPSSPYPAGKYHFGLVWEGTSASSCEGVLGEYLRFNNPHKASLYISLGLPIIVWREAAIAKFVIANGIGLVIGKLSDLSDIHLQVDETMYSWFITNVSFMSEKVRQGYFLETALEKLSESS